MRHTGEIGFAGSYPGRIQAFDLRAGQSVLVQRDSFLVAESSTQLNIAFVKKLGAGFFGGEGFILEKLTGPGTCSSMRVAISSSSIWVPAKCYRWTPVASWRSTKA